LGTLHVKLDVNLQRRFYCAGVSRLEGSFMLPLDADIGKAKALVVDGNAGSRSALVNMLHDFGIVNVVQARRAQDARRLLETQHFDIVLCEYHFDDEPVSGQDLMDDLRLAQLLPLSTVVVMISSEAGYAKVAEAAEAALDAYLVKPHTQAALRERLLQARQRKKMLKDIITLVEAEKLIEAAEICQIRFDTRGPAWLQAARVGAELWLRLGKPHAAQSMFDAILKVGAVPWARLGVARAQYDAGSGVQARRTLESLLNELPSYADAYDVMGRTLLDQGQPEKALDALRQATSLTPGSVARMVKHGLLAFYYGDPAEAAEVLAKAARLGLNSRVYDLQGLVLLAAMQFDLGDKRGLTMSLNSLSAARAPQLKSARLRRFEAVAKSLKALVERRVGDAVREVRELIAEVRTPNFEFEAACNLIALLARVTKHELQLEGLEDDVTVLARRFAVSRTTCELLIRAARAQAPFEKIIRDAYAAICTEAEDAVSKTIAGAPGEAVHLLLTNAEMSLNAKLIDLALHTIERHFDRVDGAESLKLRAEALHSQYRGYGTQVHLSRANDPRTMAAVGREK
jgi:CheY-like chemotaxis protein/Tfp pilus assembly protein PilF